MEYARLGNSDLEVSRLCLGCMGFGVASVSDGRAVPGRHSWTIDEASSAEVIRAALERGINFYDTAAVYQGGTSEQFVGRALQNLTARKNVIVATKFMPRTEEEKAAGLNGAQFVQKRLDESLRNLGMDYVDLYIMHMWDSQTPMEEIMEGLAAAVQSGKVRYLGMSNCYAYQLARLNEYARSQGYPQFISMQGHYNLLFREEEREMNRYCNEAGIALTPYSSLAAGRLAKRPGESSKRLREDYFARDKYKNTVEEDQKIIDRVVELADRYGVTMTQISLAWLLGRTTAPVVGATRLEQLDGIVEALEFRLSDEDVAYLEEPYVPHRLTGTMLLIK